MLVFAASSIGLAANRTILWALIEVVGMHMVVAKIAAAGGVFFWNYGARRLFIFRKPD
jgi:putative flippase GtrA